MSHVDPAVVARADQRMADACRRVDGCVAQFREHVALHDGEKTCPFAEAALTAFLNPLERRDLPELFAAAVMKLARPEQELPHA